MKKWLIVFVLIMLISLSFSTTTSIWNSQLVCDYYQYWTPNCMGATLWVLCNNNGSICNSASGNYLCRRATGGSGIGFRNNGWAQIDGVNWCSGINSSQSYIVECQDTYYSTPITPPLYFGCDIPNLVIESSKILSDRYRFNFTIQHFPAWGGISCSFVLNGLNASYNDLFTNSSSVIDVTYASFAKQFSTAIIFCSYNNINNQTILFASQTWLVDSSIGYVISDMNLNIDSVSLFPSILYAYDDLEYINFRVVSSQSKVDYNKPLKVMMNTSVNLASYNCSGWTNINSIYQPIIYQIETNLYCNNSATIPFNLSVYDSMTSVSITSLSFSIIWNNGSISIDNVNLIKRVTTGNLEIWATVSNDYSKSPISDYANMSCIVLATSYDTGWSSTINDMTEYRTYSSPTGGSLVQTDWYNVIDNATAYNLSNKFSIAINCQASNYENKTVYVDRWVGYRRLKMFKCVPTFSLMCSANNCPENNLYYDISNPFQTDIFGITCTAIPDMDVSNVSGSEAIIVSNLSLQIGTYQYDGISPIYVFGNMASDYNYISSCMNEIQGTTTYSGTTPKIIKSIINTRMVLQSQYTCQILMLTDGKISKDLGLWSFPPINGSPIDSVITPTTADITFDLVHSVGFDILATTLNIQNNKSGIYSGIVTEGDTLLCETPYTDPSRQIIGVVHTINDDKGGICEIDMTVNTFTFNDTFSQYSSVKVSNLTCPVLKYANASGSLTCIAIVYKYDGQTSTYTSNAIPYKSTSALKPPIDFFNLIVLSPLGWLGTFALRYPIQFMVGILVLIIIEPTLRGIIIATFKKMIGSKEGGEPKG